MMATVPAGVILVDKPVGCTSFDCIRTLRRQLSIKKMGHAGTLDPLASGLMLIGIEAGTKTLAELTKLDKEYETEILLGQSRSTGDMEGDVVDSRPVGEPLSDAVVTDALAGMIGSLNLPVSAYSAIKRDGTPLYRLAREAAAKGETVTDVPIRTMVVREAFLLQSTEIEFDASQFQLLSVRFAVGSGTYIRSLAEELGRRLGYPACVYSLRRTKVGEYQVRDATPLTEVIKIPDES